MDKESKKILKTILEKDSGSLSDGDKEFIRARRSYLSASEVEKYSEVLKEKKTEKKLDKKKEEKKTEKKLDKKKEEKKAEKK